MTRVIVAGSRSFNNFTLLERELMMYFKEHGLHRSDIEIISGTAVGADKLGEKFAEKYGLKLSKFPANWDKYGKSAGIKRNMEMATYAIEENGILFAFWNGYSKGTKHMIDIAIRNNMPTNVIEY